MISCLYDFLDSTPDKALEDGRLPVGSRGEAPVEGLMEEPVCPSVCDVNGSGPHSYEIYENYARTISRRASLFVAQRPSAYSQGNMGKFGGD